MKVKTILWLVFFLIILFGTLYYYGFVYAFRNFSGNDSWRPIAEYNFREKKQVIGQRAYQLDQNDSTLLFRKDTSERLRNYSWYSLFIYSASDTTEYFLGFPGDSLVWEQEGQSAIYLYNINNKEYDLNSVDFKKTDKKTRKKLLYDFESRFINRLKEN